MALDPSKIKILIFDLDDTLFDTLGQLVKPATLEATQAMIGAGLNAKLDKCLAVRTDLHTKNPRSDIYKQLVDHFGVRAGTKPLQVIQAGTQAFFDREIKEKIKLFDDGISTLVALKPKYRIYLVTLGTPKTQKKKVELLGLSDFMTGIFYVDYAVEKTKTAAFQEILKETGAPPIAHLSIGNRLDGEIRDAKCLGMQTCLMLHGEFAHLAPSHEFEFPDARIRKLSELESLLLTGKAGSDVSRPDRGLGRGRK